MQRELGLHFWGGVGGPSVAWRSINGGSASLVAHTHLSLTLSYSRLLPEQNDFD